VSKGLEGLDAEELISKFYGKGGGARFYDVVMRPREVVLNAVLNPNFKNNETYSDVRDELYRAISASMAGGVTLRFSDRAAAIAQLTGSIVKFEVPHMTQTPEVTITIRCDDPILRAVSPMSWVYGTSEHPGSSPILIPDGKSTAPHGFSFQLACHTDTPDFTIADQLFFPTWTFHVIPDGGFDVGDVLYFSSDYSNRYLYKVNGSTTTHLVDKISPDSVWPIVFPGQNVFHMSNLARFDWTGYLQYYPAYWGV
jgi:hypothetical protein